MDYKKRLTKSIKREMIEITRTGNLIARLIDLRECIDGGEELERQTIIEELHYRIPLTMD